MKRTINITPLSRIIREWQADSRITIETVVKELVDNGFDADASWVDIRLATLQGDKKKWCLIVRDDGHGILDMEQALKYGQSDDDVGSQRLGRHGVALKKGPARLARYLRIITTTTKRRTELYVDWEALAEQATDVWKLDEDYEPGKYRDTGTRIELLSFHSHRIGVFNKDLPQRLEAAFAPGLRDGKRIIFRGTELKYHPVEGLTETIDCEGQTASGMKFKLLAGIMEEGRKANNGFSVAFGHRVILDSWTPNFLAKYSTGRFHAEVLLVDDAECEYRWSLNTFKDDFEPWQKEELALALKPLVLKLLESIQQEKINLRIGVVESFFDKLLKEGEHQEKIRTKEGEDTEIHIGAGGSGGTRIRTSKISQQPVTRSDKGKKQELFRDKAFQLEFDDLHENSDMWKWMEVEPLTLIINRLHVKGAALEQAIINPATDRETASAVAEVVLILSSYLTSRPDASKRYPFLLNGTDDLHKMMLENASKWLLKAELAFST